MIGDLSGKCILVTGASSGIGRASAVGCAEAGARVVLLARNADRLEQTRKLCGEGEHLVVAADLSDLDAIGKLVRSVVADVGPLDGLVHSAGIHQLKPLRVLKSEDLLTLFSVNAAAGVMLVKALAARGNHAGQASAVLLSSVLGRVGQAGATAYSMSKAALEGAVKCMALELAGEGIRVNAVAPAFIDTEMTTRAMDMLDESLRENVRRAHPSGFGRPQDVAAAVCYLLSDAARYVTGTSLSVDGGYTAQ